MDYRNDSYRGDESTKRPLRETGAAAAAAPPTWSALFRRAEVSIERLIRKYLNRLRRQQAGAGVGAILVSLYGRARAGAGRGQGSGTSRAIRLPKRAKARRARSQSPNPLEVVRPPVSAFSAKFSEPKTDIKPIRQFVRRRHEKSDTLLRVQAAYRVRAPN